MVQSAKEVIIPKNINIMIYGDNTTGKTVCAMTAPKPLLILDIDNRPQTYAGMEDVDFEIYSNSGSSATAYRDLSSTLRTLSRDKNLKYKTIVLDSTTGLLDIITDDLLGLTGSGSGAHEGLDLKHWGTVDERYRKLFGILRALDCITIAISHEQMFKDELTGEITYATMHVGKKIAKKAPGYFDEIYRAFTEKDRRTKEVSYLLQTQRDRKYPARTSFNLRDENGRTIPILDPVEPQDIGKMLDKIEWAQKNPEEAVKKIKKERDL